MEKKAFETAFMILSQCNKLTESLYKFLQRVSRKSLNDHLTYFIINDIFVQMLCKVEEVDFNGYNIEIDDTVTEKDFISYLKYYFRAFSKIFAKVSFDIKESYINKTINDPFCQVLQTEENDYYICFESKKYFNINDFKRSCPKPSNTKLVPIIVFDLKDAELDCFIQPITIQTPANDKPSTIKIIQYEIIKSKPQKTSEEDIEISQLDDYIQELEIKANKRHLIKVQNKQIIKDDQNINTQIPLHIVTSLREIKPEIVNYLESTEDESNNQTDKKADEPPSPNQRFLFISKDFGSFYQTVNGVPFNTSSDLIQYAKNKLSFINPEVLYLDNNKKVKTASSNINPNQNYIIQDFPKNKPSLLYPILFVAGKNLEPTRIFFKITHSKNKMSLDEKIKKEFMISSADKAKVINRNGILSIYDTTEVIIDESTVDMILGRVKVRSNI